MPLKERQCKLGESEEQARAPWAFKVLSLKSCLKEPAGQVVQHADVSTDECTLELSQVSAAVEENAGLGAVGNGGGDPDDEASATAAARKQHNTMSATGFAAIA